MITQVENPPLRRSELCAVAGGVLLLVSFAAPVDWFKQVDSGGFAGDGCGRGTMRRTAVEIFGAWSIPVVLAALAPIVEFALRTTGRTFAPWARLIAVAVGLGVLAVGVIDEIDPTTLDPNACYWQTTDLPGLVVGGVGSALLLIWALAEWAYLRQR